MAKVFSFAQRATRFASAMPRTSLSVAASSAGARTILSGELRFTNHSSAPSHAFARRLFATAPAGKTPNDKENNEKQSDSRKEKEREAGSGEQSSSSASSGSSSAAARNKSLAFYLVAGIAGMIAVSYAAVPLYRLFCQVTGLGGTTQRCAVLFSSLRCFLSSFSPSTNYP